MNSALKARIWSVIEPMHGWCSREKSEAMSDLIGRVLPSTCVEIGVFGGRSLIAQGMALKEVGDGVVYGIDPWRMDAALEGNLSTADKEWWSGINLNEIHLHCMDSIWRNGLDKQCIVIRASSQYCPRLFGGGIDVLHIDGTHSEEASTRDVILYLPQVRSGGHIWFDDSDWTTTSGAVSILRKECKELTGVGPCLLFQKT